MKVCLHVSCRTLLLCSALALASVLILEAVSANPIAGPSRPHDTAFRADYVFFGLSWLFVLNLLVNTALLSIGFLLVARFAGPRLGNFSDKTLAFLARYLACIIFVTIIGALVDFLLVTREVYTTYWTGLSLEQGYYRMLYPDAVSWSVACVLIFVSIFASLVLALGMFVRHSLVIAIGITVVNPIWWTTIYYLGEDVTFLTLLFGILASPVLLFGVIRWHATDYSTHLAAAARAAA